MTTFEASIAIPGLCAVASPCLLAAAAAAEELLEPILAAVPELWHGWLVGGAAMACIDPSLPYAGIDIMVPASTRLSWEVFSPYLVVGGRAPVFAAPLRPHCSIVTHITSAEATPCRVFYDIARHVFMASPDALASIRSRTIRDVVFREPPGAEDLGLATRRLVWWRWTTKMVAKGFRFEVPWSSLRLVDGAGTEATLRLPNQAERDAEPGWQWRGKEACCEVRRGFLGFRPCPTALENALHIAAVAASPAALPPAVQQPHLWQLLNMRTLVLRGRAHGGTPLISWLIGSAPLWVLVRLSALLASRDPCPVHDVAP